MRHLRDAIITILGIFAMHWTTITLSQALWPWRQSVGWAESLWFGRAVDFVVAFVIGATLMKLLRWRLKVLAIIALPVLLALAAPFWIYAESRAYGAESFALDAILLVLMTAMTIVGGLLAGVLFVHKVLHRAAATGPNKSLERTRDR